MSTKICTKCDEEKALSEFANHRNGLRANCKMCTLEYQRQYRAANKEKLQPKKKESNAKHYQKVKAQRLVLKEEKAKAKALETTKTCTKCHEEKELSEFGKRDQGLRADCKSCVAEYHKEYRAANEEKIKEDKKVYRQANSEKMTKRDAEYYATNKERILSEQRAYRAANLEQVRTRERKSSRKHAERKRQYANMYYHTLTPEKRYQRRKTNNARKKLRMQNDMNYRLREALRSRLWHAVKNKQGIKSAHTMELTGCTIEFLVKYLEDQFSEGMSWNNYGAWHIDHELPCAMFDLTQKCEQEKCFHYTNLQPLWSKDNLTKSDKVAEDDAILTAVYLLFEERHNNIA